MSTDAPHRTIHSHIGIAVLVLLAATAYIILQTDIAPAHRTPILGFLTICGVTGVATAAAIRRQPVSVAVVVFPTAFVFFGIAPLAQLLTDSWVLSISPTHILEAQLIILLWLAALMVAYAFAQRRPAPLRDEFQLEVTPRVTVVCWVGALATSAFLIALFGPTAFLTRASLTAARETTFLPTEIAFLIQRVVRPMALLFAFIPVAQRRWGRPTGFRPRRVTTYAVLLVALFVNNPTGSVRLYAFAVVLGGFIIWFAHRLKSGFPVFVATFGGLLASQAAEAFRYATSLSGAAAAFEPESLTEYLASTHFDSFENVMLSIEYVAREGHTGGYQLLGGVVFWVPRVLWPSKPVGTGDLLYRYYDAAGLDVAFYNHAVAPPATAYLDFGFAAVIGLGLLHGVVMGALDRRIAVGTLRIRRPGNGVFRVDYGIVALSVLVGLWLVHVRGGWLSTTAIMAYYLLGAWVVWHAVRVAEYLPETVSSWASG